MRGGTPEDPRRPHHRLHVISLWALGLVSIALLSTFLLARPSTVVSERDAANWIALMVDTEPAPTDVSRTDDSDHARFGTPTQTATVTVDVGSPTRVEVIASMPDVISTMALGGVRVSTVSFMIPQSAVLASPENPCEYLSGDSLPAMTDVTQTLVLPQSQLLPGGHAIAYRTIECAVFHLDEDLTKSGPIVRLHYSVDLTTVSARMERAASFHNVEYFALAVYAQTEARPWSEYAGELVIELRSPAGSRLIDFSPISGNANLTAVSSSAQDVGIVYLDTSAEAVVQLTREAGLLVAGAALAVLTGALVAGDRFRRREWIPAVAVAACLAVVSCFAP